MFTRRDVFRATAALGLGAAGVRSVAVTQAASVPKSVSIFSLVQPLNNPWVINNARFQREVAEALGIHLQLTSDGGTDESNVAAMRAMIAAQPDGILYDPISEAAGQECIRLIEENKLITVVQDRLAIPSIAGYKGEYLRAQVTEGGTDWGYRTMQNLAEAGAKKIVLIMPPHGILTNELMWKGAREYLQQHPEIKLVEEAWVPHSRESAVEAMQRFLAKYTPGSDIDGVFAIGSIMGLGALFAIERAGAKGQIKVITADDDPDVMAALKSGGLVSTLGGHWMVGGFGLIVLYDILNGHAPLDKQPVFHLIQVNAQTADAYQARFLWSKESPFSADELRSLSLTYNPAANLPGLMTNLWQTWSSKSRGL
jgi:ABC-type sugar transport system substrate-binding protein